MSKQHQKEHHRRTQQPRFANTPLSRTDSIELEDTWHIKLWIDRTALRSSSFQASNRGHIALPQLTCMQAPWRFGPFNRKRRCETSHNFYTSLYAMYRSSEPCYAWIPLMRASTNFRDAADMLDVIGETQCCRIVSDTGRAMQC